MYERVKSFSCCLSCMDQVVLPTPNVSLMRSLSFVEAVSQ